MNTPDRWQRWFVFRPWERHGLLLMVGGLIYVAVGFSFLTSGDLTKARELSLDVALNVLPMSVWSCIFIVVGLLAMLSSRWPDFHESWGYMVLTSLSAAWSAIYFLGYFLSDAPRANMPYGLVWGLIAFMWWGIVGLITPEGRQAVEVDHEST